MLKNLLQDSGSKFWWWLLSESSLISRDPDYVIATNVQISLAQVEKDLTLLKIYLVFCAAPSSCLTLRSKEDWTVRACLCWSLGVLPTSCRRPAMAAAAIDFL